MTDRTQFEAMLEALINEDQETAKEIFHNIVVAKSREIYEELLESDFPSVEEEEEDDSADDAEDDSADDAEDDSADDVGGDATDDFIDDVSDDEEDNEFGSEEGEGDVEARVMDLEDALDELKAEFEQLMAGEEGEEHMGGDDMGAEMGGDDMGADPMGADPMGAPEDDEMAQFMEYVDKVALPKHGDNGVQTRSTVAGSNNMGGTTANIAKSFSTTTGGTAGGLLKPSTDKQDGGNINVPGGNAGKTAFKKKEPGHGAEKKGAGDTAPDKKSLIGSRK